MSDKARKVISSLASKPGLFYEVARTIFDEYDIAGPWEQISDGTKSGKDPEQWVRRNILREAVVQVVFDDVADLWTYNTSGAQGTQTTADLARGMSDIALNQAGYLLAP